MIYMKLFTNNLVEYFNMSLLDYIDFYIFIFVADEYLIIIMRKYFELTGLCFYNVELPLN